MAFTGSTLVEPTSSPINYASTNGNRFWERLDEEQIRAPVFILSLDPRPPPVLSGISGPATALDFSMEPYNGPFGRFSEWNRQPANKENLVNNLSAKLTAWSRR
jgi:hypothetical protein